MKWATILTDAIIPLISGLSLLLFGIYTRNELALPLGGILLWRLSFIGGTWMGMFKERVKVMGKIKYRNEKPEMGNDIFKKGNV